ncbi:imidazolonepropionase [Povalibacter sp.]|uniref:imidazolonepropionase n=1 Tax=Povalibacter sp. TaxID=1962978 RepID=UPI002F4272CE
MNVPTQQPNERVWRNARLATMARGTAGIGIIENGAVVSRDGTLVFVGSEKDLPSCTHSEREEIDCEGRWITPGLVDCHTHLVHAGNRAHEFELRLRGATYQEIAAAGGGIISTLRSTRTASKEQLIDASLPRLDALIGEGVTTIEIKSGYGLDLATERRLLEAAQELSRIRPIHVHKTFLGAHAVPPEMAGRADAYIELLTQEMLPTLAAENLIDSVDGFCEHIAFTPAQIERVFATAASLGLRVRLHADQLSNLAGARLAATHHALSADHLEFSDESSIQALALSGTVAVLLPGAYYFLRERTAPRVDLLRLHHVPIAVATDCNPGTSPLTSLLLTMNMAATQFRLTVDECLLGVTRHAASALGMDNAVGTLEAGKRADLAIWNIEHPAELVYRMGFNPLHSRIWRGR